MTPELLAPAGSLKMLDTALDFGATAIYAGQPRYSLRVRNNDFGDLPVLAEGIARSQARGARFYLVSNIFPHGAKLKTYLKDMAPAIALGPDALIMSDPGLILMVRETWPEMEIHLSVQANTVNSAAVRFWKQAGVARVILSRELSLDEVAEIRQACPDTELEVFVHGALCVAYSGRCLLSGYFNHRDPNQGSCTNSCRWDYKVHPAKEDAAGDVWLIEERERRQGDYMAVEEDEHGTYVLNSKDLRAIEHVQRLVEIGVDSLKIEGRTKSPYYVARTVQAYRQAIDDAAAGRPWTRPCWANSKAWPIEAIPTASINATPRPRPRTTCAATPNPAAAFTWRTWSASTPTAAWPWWNQEPLRGGGPAGTDPARRHPRDRPGPD